jgi:hypothetical protein
MAPPLRQGRRRLRARLPRAVCLAVRRGHRSLARRAHAGGRVHTLHPVADRAVHRDRRYSHQGQCARDAGAQHRVAGGGHGHGERDGHDGRVDAVDPTAAARQRFAALPRTRGRVLHLPGGQHRRFADAAGRPAAVPRLPQGCGLLLDHQGDAAANAGVGGRAAGGLLPARQLVLPAGRSDADRPDARLAGADRGLDQLAAVRPADPAVGPGLRRVATRRLVRRVRHTDRTAEPGARYR